MNPEQKKLNANSHAGNRARAAAVRAPNPIYINHVSYPSSLTLFIEWLRFLVLITCLVKGREEMISSHSMKARYFSPIGECS